MPLTDFTLPPELEAHDPPEARGLARDGVRLLVSRTASGEISHHGFRKLPGLLLPGDLLVVNTSQTLPGSGPGHHRARGALLQPASGRIMAGRAAPAKKQDLPRRTGQAPPVSPSPCPVGRS